MVSSVGLRDRIWTVGDGIAWLRARPWTYVYVVFAMWGLFPELRRVIDWKSSFASVSIVSILPLLALVPAAIAVVKKLRRQSLPREAIVLVWLWLGAFGYGYAVALAVGNAVPATYTLAGFLLPMFFGLLPIGWRAIDGLALYERIASFALKLSVPIALYAFYQYVAPPPWDLFWLEQTHLVSVGIAEAFGFRPFGTLNAPGPFADFLVFILILNLPRVRGAKVWRGFAIALDVAALAMTLVRADWIALAIAVVVFVALSPRKVANLSAIGVVALVVGLFAGNASTIFGSDQADGISERFTSLGDITTDVSFVERQRLFGEALSNAIAEPTGEGLGVLGTAAKLGSGGATVDFDNGYIARFTELGYFGMAAYLAAILAMFAVTARRWWVLNRAGDAQAASIAAAALGLQAALIFLDTSSDHHSLLSALFFWLAFGLVFEGDVRVRGMGPDPAR
jgi:hypothetical protein